jgi:protein-S-isoprenylcysteine O-methyltransferase Ste14
MMWTGESEFGLFRWVAGLTLMVLGEGVRLAAVGHIGPASRTRDDSATRVVDTGPYAIVRNPLYIGNLCLWAGLGVLLWPWALVAPMLLGCEYVFIVRWEEHNLRRQLGLPYEAYCARVSRWWPRPSADGVVGRWDGRMALRSERSTLLVIVLALAVASLRAVAVR